MKSARRGLEVKKHTWGPAFSGASKRTPLYPDYPATYWVYSITRKNNDTTGLKIEGNFTHARYQSFVIYNDKTGGIIDSIVDVDIKPDTGSRNPFRLKVDRNTTPRKYTLAVIPDTIGALKNNSQTFSNVIKFHPGMEHISIFLRVYLPDFSVRSTNDNFSGGTPLPKITPFNVITGKRAPYPKRRKLPVILGTGVIRKAFANFNVPTNTDGNVLFYRLSGKDYFYTNPDNVYLISYMANITNKVIMLRFKPPIARNTYYDCPKITSQKETRYWSINVGGRTITNALGSVVDFQAIVAKDGFVNVVIGPPTAEIINKAQGLNFVPTGVQRRVVIIYRQMLPVSSFKNSNEHVPAHVESKGINDSADHFIGDYAPKGIYCSTKKFLKDFGKFDFSFA